MAVEMSPLSTNLMHLLNNEPIKTAVDRFSETDGSFANILTDAFANTNATDAITQNGTMELLTGENDDLSGLLLDMQKAELALQLTLQIRNKIMDAYNEVMRMSI